MCPLLSGAYISKTWACCPYNWKIKCQFSVYKLQTLLQLKRKKFLKMTVASWIFRMPSMQALYLGSNELYIENYGMVDSFQLLEIVFPSLLIISSRSSLQVTSCLRSKNRFPIKTMYCLLSSRTYVLFTPSSPHLPNWLSDLNAFSCCCL